MCFVLGFATIFVILGASATALGQALISYRYELNLIGGVIVIGFGLFATGLLHLRGFSAISGLTSCFRAGVRRPPISWAWRSRLAGLPALVPCWGPFSPSAPSQPR
ncbi:cytochrome c biogenesis CcdA family protein [Bradyrhizobium sp. RDT10]